MRRFHPLITGTLILTSVGFFCRILGFFYRIFLSRTIGAEGLGLYQMIFPIHGIAFALCAGPIQTSLSRLTAASPEKGRAFLRVSLALSLSIALPLTSLIYTFADFLAARVLLAPECAPLLPALALSIPFCAIHACCCGYYYGLKKTAGVSHAILPKDFRHHSVKVLSISEQNLFLKYAKGTIFYPIYEIALSTGMRSGELRGLQWNDIDFDKGIIHVTHSLLYFNHIGYCLGATKTENSVRDIPMLDNVKSILKELRVKRFSNYQQNDIITIRNSEFSNLIFTNPNGTPINRNQFKIELNRVVTRIQKDYNDFPHVTPHMFRHTFATRGIERGIPPKVLQAIMGHKSLATTMEIYAHVLPDTKAEEMKKLRSLFS